MLLHGTQNTGRSAAITLLSKLVASRGHLRQAQLNSARILTRRRPDLVGHSRGPGEWIKTARQLNVPSLPQSSPGCPVEGRIPREDPHLFGGWEIRVLHGATNSCPRRRTPAHQHCETLSRVIARRTGVLGWCHGVFHWAHSTVPTWTTGAIKLRPARPTVEVRSPIRKKSYGSNTPPPAPVSRNGQQESKVSPL